MKKWITAILCVGAALATALNVKAAEPEGWKFEVTPYAWFQGFDGTLTVNDEDYDFDMKFSDLVDSVQLAGSLLAIAQYDRWLVWGQTDYAALDSDNNDDTRPASLEIDEFFAIAAAGYQFDTFKGNTIDVLVGARYASLENTLTIKPTDRKINKNYDSLDPVLVARPSFRITEKLRFNPTLSIGGGGDADLVYELQPQLQYAFTENIAGRVGYRRVHYEFSNDNGNELEINFSGAIVGLGILF